jgi:hypothetical protein
MQTFLAFFVLIAFICALAGFAWPKKLMPWRENPHRANVFSFYLAISIAAFIGFGVTMQSPETIREVTAPPVVDQPLAHAALTPASITEPAKPELEAAFISSIARFADEYQAAPNELKKSAVAQRRAAELKKLLGNDARAVDWLGVIENMGTTGNGNAHVVIKLTSNITVKTHNAELFDSGDKTLIRHGSALFEKLANMSDGQTVRFSGRLLDEVSLTESGRMLEPEFMMRFTDISPAP